MPRVASSSSSNHAPQLGLERRPYAVGCPQSSRRVIAGPSRAVAAALTLLVLGSPQGADAARRGGVVDLRYVADQFFAEGDAMVLAVTHDKQFGKHNMPAFAQIADAASNGPGEQGHLFFEALMNPGQDTNIDIRFKQSRRGMEEPVSHVAGTMGGEGVNSNGVGQIAALAPRANVHFHLADYSKPYRDDIGRFIARGSEKYSNAALITGMEHVTSEVHELDSRRFISESPELAFPFYPSSKGHTLETQRAMYDVVGRSAKAGLRTALVVTDPKPAAAPRFSAYARVRRMVELTVPLLGKAIAKNATAKVFISESQLPLAQRLYKAGKPIVRLDCHAVPDCKDESASQGQARAAGKPDL